MGDEGEKVRSYSIIHDLNQKEIFETLKLKSDKNRRCIECDAPDPQWASPTYGIFICMECSGKHRSLGTHISVVKSLSLDKWSPQHLQQMKVGGNDACIRFFEEYEVPANMHIKDKYDSQIGELYRQKISLESQGKTWTPPYEKPPPPTASATKVESGEPFGRPRWIPDREAQTCAKCDELFTVTNRRHHCRSCGKVFCSACCKEKYYLYRLGYKDPVRVCKNCSQAMSPEAKALH